MYMTAHFPALVHMHWRGQTDFVDPNLKNYVRYIKNFDHHVASVFSFMCIICRSLFFLSAIVLSVLLRFTDSDYSFDIFKLFFQTFCFYISKHYLPFEICSSCSISSKAASTSSWSGSSSSCPIAFFICTSRNSSGTRALLFLGFLGVEVPVCTN